MLKTHEYRRKSMTGDTGVLFSQFRAYCSIKLDHLHALYIRLYTV